jgi:hypothetical protein
MSAWLVPSCGVRTGGHLLRAVPFLPSCRCLLHSVQRDAILTPTPGLLCVLRSYFKSRVSHLTTYGGQCCHRGRFSCSAEGTCTYSGCDVCPLLLLFPSPLLSWDSDCTAADRHCVAHAQLETFVLTCQAQP